MNEPEIRYQTDDEIFALPDVARLMTPKRRNRPMKFPEVKTLVEALQPGMARAANLECYGQFWRLRFLLRVNGSRCVRRSILIDDALTMEWVRDYIDWGRSKRREYKADVASIEFQKWWESGGKQLADSISAKFEAYTGVAKLED
ncbi:MAG: hypothetical protein LUG50_07375 [Planctomycetaceae bacterium]|nr:hypothetical protein [Planctomycetaceae bacterium]